MLFIIRCYICKFVNFIRGGNNKRTDVVFVFLFVFLLCFPVMHISKATKSDKENRVLAVKPSFFVDGKINKKYGSQFDSWFSDHFNGRSLFVDLFSKISYKISRIYQNDKALFIKNNGWMFLKNKPGIPSDKDFDLVLANLKKFDDFCSKYNMKLYILLPPAKEAVYSEIFDDNYGFDNELETKFRSYIYRLSKVFGKNKIIYPYNDLRSARSKDYVYFKQSHHWTDFGAFVGYNILSSRIKQDFPDYYITSLSDYNKVVSNKIREEYARDYSEGYSTIVLNLRDYVDDVLTVDYNYYDNKEQHKVVEKRERYIKFFENKNPNMKYKLFLTGNSQSENLLQFLPYSVKQLKYVRLNGGQQSNEDQHKFMKFYKKELLDFKPDIVVINISDTWIAWLMKDFYKD